MESSVIQNSESRRLVLISAPDASLWQLHPRHMPTSTTADWELQAWMGYFGKRQASLVNELGWEKSKANDVWHGKRPYRRDLVNEIATWLGLEPFELLMIPERAMALRRLRQTAQLIVAESGADFEQAPTSERPGSR